MKTIEFTNDEYKQLLMLVNLGLWVSSASKDEADEPDEIQTAQEALNQKILAKAKDFAADDLVVYDEEDERYLTSEDIDEDMVETMVSYDENTFWQELIMRLSLRDAAAELGVEEVFDFETELSGEEIENRVNILMNHEEKWGELFAEKSLDTLVAA